MKQAAIAAQLYSFRDYIKTPAGVRDTLNRLKKIGYSAVQLNGALVSEMPAPELMAILKETGMQAPTCHYDAKTLITDPQPVIARMKEIGCFHAAYPYPHWLPSGRGEAIAFAQELERAAEQFQAAGLELAYHNHALEFVRFEGRTLLDLIYSEAPHLQGEIDTYWVQCGGGNPVSWLRRLAGRQRVLHLKDYGMIRQNNDWRHGMMAVGDGNLDWTAILLAAEEAGVEWYVVEHDADTTAPFASFAASMNYLKSHFVK